MLLSCLLISCSTGKNFLYRLSFELDIRIARVDCFGNRGQIFRQIKRPKSFHCQPHLEILNIIIYCHVIFNFHAYPELINAIGRDIIAQINKKSWMTGLNNENGKVCVSETTIENFAFAKLIFDSALIRSYVFVNNAISMFSNKMLTKIRKRISRRFDIPCFQSFHWNRFRPRKYQHKKIPAILFNIIKFYGKLSCSGQSDFPASSPKAKTHSVLSGASFRTKLISGSSNSPKRWKKPFSETNFTSVISSVYSSLKSFFNGLSFGSPSTKICFSSRLKQYVNKMYCKRYQ